MKPALFLVPVLTCALVILSGCHSASRNPSKASAASTGGVTTTTALPSSSAPASVTPPPASKVALPTIRINAGSGEVKDATGVAWAADTGFSGGDVVERPDLPIANTKQPEIYRSEHYSMESFAQKLPNGKYQVKLHFCETFEGITAPGERVFSFDVEGKTFKDFDVWVYID